MFDINEKINKPLNNEKRLKLDELIRNTEEYVDNTEKIRELKHSKKLIASVGIIEMLKIQYSDIKNKDMNVFSNICKEKCPFFYNNYTEIFNKLINDEIDLQTLSQFLQVLQAIEQSKIDQQEGSVIIGELLKKLYVDSALKKAAKLDLMNNENKKENEKEIIDRGISWKEYKKNINFLKNSLKK